MFTRKVTIWSFLWIDKYSTLGTYYITVLRGILCDTIHYAVHKLETTELPRGLGHSQVDAIEEKDESKSIGKRRVGRGTNGKRRLPRNLGAIVD